MKYHRVLVEAVLGAVSDIFETGRKADRVIEFVLKSDKRWGARDRAFVAENVYEMVRWWRLLEFVTPAPHTHWARFAAWQILKGQTLPAWPEFEAVAPDTIKKRHTQAQKIRKIKESIPDWLDATGEAELGKQWDSELTALNQTAPVVLRANALKISVVALQEELQKADIESHLLPQLPHALVLTEKKNIFQNPLFKEGFFEVQDAGSQTIAPFLDVQPGMRVIDACAGAGGKTLHLAALMQNKGQLIALDVEDWKLQELRRRARRNGVSNAEARLIEPKTIKRLYRTADRLLLDVPCTGLGVLRRNPDTKWKLQPEFLEKIKHTQREILENYAQMVKPNGKMVYATCSILPSESEGQVQHFLQNHRTEWQLLNEQRTSPAQDGFDGFYMACLQRK